MSVVPSEYLAYVHFKILKSLSNSENFMSYLMPYLGDGYVFLIVSKSTAANTRPKEIGNFTQTSFSPNV